jgi:hypothetical protein
MKKSEILKSYDDLGIYFVTLDEKYIVETLKNIISNFNILIPKKINISEEIKKGWILLTAKTDERIKLFSYKAFSPFWGVAIKCKLNDKQTFFNSLEPWLSDTQEGFGIPKSNINEYRDWLHNTLIDKNGKTLNPIKDGLLKYGLLNETE